MTYILTRDRRPVAVVQMDTFTQDVKRIWSEAELAAFTDYIARNPDGGDIVPGTGGFRKIRWATQGQGKRGGARVIYYFHDIDRPIYLTAIYAKGEKANLTAAERNELKVIAAEMKRF